VIEADASESSGMTVFPSIGADANQ
jgi:hypothetical protein